MYDLLPCALVLVAVALVTDLETRRIPNGLTLPSLLFGLAVQTAVHGWAGAVVGLAGILAGGGLLLVPFLRGFTGAGDVKLAAAVGVFVGPLAVVVMILLATLIAGLLAWAVATRRGLLGTALRGALRVGTGRRPALSSIGSLPFAVPIAVGTLLAAPCLELLVR